MNQKDHKCTACGTECDCEHNLLECETCANCQENTYSTPCGSMSSEEIREHVLECGICAAEHADIPLDL